MTGANVIGCEVHDITNHLEHDDPFQLFTYLLPTGRSYSFIHSC